MCKDIIEYYRIFRRRQEQKWWTDITDHYSMSGEISDGTKAHEYAIEYKRLHQSDSVKVVKISEEVCYIA